MPKSLVLLLLCLLPGFSGGVLAAELTVSAAASLTGAFRDIAQGYQGLHPEVRVLLNFGGSGALQQQIAKGAPVDVFASADQETMDQAAGRDLIDAVSRRDFARNALVLVVPRDSTLRLAQLADLAQPGVERFALGNPASVPAGRYAMRALEAAALRPALQDKMIHTQSVRQALDYVARGEVAAGFVYATDARAMPDRVAVAFSVPLDTAIRYPVARTRDSAQAAEAGRFIDYLLSPAGQAILARHGFDLP
ncbi:MAG TPA: molybdate ABC transporter substrate-binding protein [Pseudomonas sp.]|nr:molybdate ABC transporter substrate-binding protein [Pseudomonas sp.]